MPEYSPQTWVDRPSTSTPISAARLAHIEAGIAGLAAAFPWVAVEDYYEDADGSDWGLTVARALAAATPDGKAVRLSGYYPVETTIQLSSGDALVGLGPTTGLYGPVGDPVKILNADAVSNVVLADFKVDGGADDSLGDEINIRGIEFEDSTDLLLTGLTLQNVADWAVSFVECSNVVVKNHTHLGGGGAEPGGRDGVHFLDCHDCVLDGGVFWTGDDCVSVTSLTTGSSRITIRNVTGCSDAAAIVKIDIEAASAFPNTDITIDGVTSWKPDGVDTTYGLYLLTQNGSEGRRWNISNVQVTAQLMGIYITNVDNSTDKLTDVVVSNCVLASTALHGFFARYVDRLFVSNVRSRSAHATDGDGFNIEQCRWVSLVGVESHQAANWGLQLNACTTVDVVNGSFTECGGGVFASNTGGAATIVNCTNATVHSGTFTGSTSVSYRAIYVVGGTNTVINPAVRRSALNSNTGNEGPAASTTVPGVVELATSAETITGSDTARAVTPAGLAAKVASTTASGIVELATDAETITGTDTTRALTPSNLQALTATDSRDGIVELATSTETIVGSDTARAVTPAGLLSAIGSRRLTSGQETIPREQISVQTLVTASQNLRLTYFTAYRSETIQSVRLFSGSTAAGATPTVVRVGVYSVAGNGDLTLVGSTTNDTTLLGTISTKYEKAFSSSFAVTAGQRYAVGLLVVTGATAPFVAGHTSPVPTDTFSAAPRLAGNLTGQSDLPASTTDAALSGTTQLMYFALLP